MEQETEQKEIETKVTGKQIADRIMADKEQYQQATLNQRNEFNDIYAAYIGDIKDNNDKSKSQEKIMKLRTEVSYIVPSIFSGSPEIEVESIGEEDKDFAMVAEKIINHRFETIPNFYEKVEAWVKQSTVFGTSIIKAIWKFETEDQEDGTAYPKTDEPDVEVPNILDCFYNPIIPDIYCQKPVFRSVLPVSEVKENEMYDFTDEMGNLNREKVESRGTTSTNPYDSSRQVSSDLIDVKKSSEGTVEVYEQISEDRIETICEGKERLVLRSVKNPDKMVTAVKLIHEPNAIPNRFDGYGVGHNTLGIGTLYQKLSNKIIDNVSFGNNPHFIGQKGMGLDKRQLVTKCGGITEVDTGGEPLSNFIQPLPVPDIKQGAIELLNRIDDDHKRASGANDLLQGAASNKTLGQDEIASTYSSNRFELINRRFKSSLSELARMLFIMEINRIQSPDADILKIFPLEAEIQNGQIVYSRETVYQMLISEEAKNAKFNIRVKGETNIAKNKQYNLRQFNDWLKMFLPLLPPKNQMECGKKWLEMAGIGDTDKLVPDPDTMEQPQEQMQGQQGMSQQPPQ